MRGSCVTVGKADDSHLKSAEPFGNRSWGKPPRPRCLTTVLSPQRTADAPASKIAALTPRHCLPNAVAPQQTPKFMKVLKNQGLEFLFSHEKIKA
ncbi:hypothetical protein LC593_26645 [Nostoc sp. CHAB 5844]|nr:hypothetical protein [Nostoc sp. CHAB 5844]